MVSSRFGRTLFGLKNINEPESDINKIEADDFYYYYEDYDDRLETTIIERRPKSLLTPVIRPPQRYVAPYLNQQRTHEKTVEKRQNISLLDFDIYPTLRPPPIDFTEFPLHDIFEDSDDYNSIDDQSIAHKINDHHIETTTFSNINTDYKDTIFNDYSENSVESEDDISDNSETDNVCPGNNLRQCIEACVPLPKLWVYSVCVRECANRCP